MTGKQGDRSLAQTFRRSGHRLDPGYIPDRISGLRRLPFPGQPGHASVKLMPAAAIEGLLELVQELDASVLSAHRALLVSVVRELSAEESHIRKAEEVTSRYPELAMVEGGDTINFVVRPSSTPRVVYFALLKAFAPRRNPSELYNHGGLKQFLRACGVSPLDGLADDSCGTTRPANPLPSDESTSPFESILPYERALGAKSEGMIYGSCAYADGSPTLLADLPIVILTLLRLRTVVCHT
jgi:hypothetical protein